MHKGVVSLWSTREGDENLDMLIFKIILETQQ